MKDVVVCCEHSNKFFVDTNGLLTDLSCDFFCAATCNMFTQVYLFVCPSCLAHVQRHTVSLYELNFEWKKHYLDKRDTRQIILSGLFRFCSIHEASFSYDFCAESIRICRNDSNVV